MEELRNTKRIRHTESKQSNGRNKSFISNTLNGNIRAIKRQGLAERIFKKSSTRCLEALQTPKKTENKSLKKDIPSNQKRADTAILLSYKVHFKLERFTRGKEGHYICIKVSIKIGVIYMHLSTDAYIFLYICIYITSFSKS